MVQNNFSLVNFLPFKDLTPNDTQPKNKKKKITPKSYNAKLGKFFLACIAQFYCVCYPYIIFFLYLF